MKGSATALFVAALLFSASAYSQDGQPRPEGQPRPRPEGGGQQRPGGPGGPGGRGNFLMAMPVHAALDLDKNGEISAEELSKATESLKALDKNGDGKLTEEEIRPDFGGRGPGGPGGRPEGGRPQGGRPEGGNRPEGGAPQRPPVEP
ncbi:MAG: EF-hand domain-containing protein [Verrucomicrobiae bacterium]|nr:EF-hand domain-containing protein [Verrucomicrobiae bacterium]